MRNQTSGILVLLLSQLAGCGEQMVGWPTPDELPPTVSNTNPADLQTSVSVNTMVVAIFSEGMDPLSITDDAFTLKDGATVVPGQVTYEGVTATFDPMGDLDPNTEYTATIADTVSDVAGNRLASPYEWTFTSGQRPDNTPPTVTFTVPGEDAVDVPTNRSVSVTFSEMMDLSTLNATTFSVSDGADVAGLISYTGVTLRFDPSVEFEPDTTYTVVVESDVTDLAGNPMVADYTWTFDTGAITDVQRPNVDFTIPGDDDDDVALNGNIAATFDEAMDPATLNTANFTVQQQDIPIPGTVSYANLTATFNPTVDLLSNTTYSATITTAAQDLAGNALAQNYVWNFDTGTTADTSRPLVVSTIPLDLAIDVALNTNVSATFNEPMDVLSINSTSFLLEDGGVPVPGIVTLAGSTAQFNPTVNLDPSTEYTATVTTAAQDLAGNTLAADYLWTFTTGAALDTTRPLVISTIPIDLAIDVAFNTNVTATFNEPMDALSINSTSFLLEDGGIPVPGVVTLAGSTAQFNPTVNLNPATEYTATVTTAAQDLAGNTLATDYLWTFTTGAPLDTTAPQVILVDPLDLATNVPINSTVSATFDEMMNPLSINAATFVVTGPLNTPVLGTMIYDTIGREVTFTPSVPLLESTTYNARVTIGATDLAGNPLATDFTWTFATAAPIYLLAPVNLRSLSTFVAVAGAGLTNSNSSGTTTLNGDVGLSPTATCLGDGSPCTALNPVINGTLYANDPGGVAAQAKVDLTAAYVDAMSRPVGTTVNDISGMTLAPGVYTSNSTMSVAVGQTVTLDGQGDQNAVWIFQIGSSLTVNNNAQLLLVNGAQAKHVFWGVFASSTLGNNVDFKGSVLAGASNSVGTDTVVLGRLLSTTGQITLLSDTITIP